MADENQVSDQTQQVAAETPEQVPNQGEGQSDQANPGQHTGFQKRIDELTAKRYEAERQSQALQAQLLEREQMMARMMAAMTQAQQQQQPDPAADLAPEDRRRIEATVSPRMKALEERLAQVTGQLEQQMFATQLNQETPAVQQLAKTLLGQWRQQGLQGWTMEDAVIYARGRLVGQDTSTVTQARNERGQFTATAQNVTRTQSAPPNPTPRVDQGLPANFDKLTAQEQADVLEKRLEGIPL